MSIIAPAQPVVQGLMTVRQAAKYLGISERSLYSITAPRGTLRSVRCRRIIRYEMCDIREWIEKNKPQRQPNC